jgi:acylphosphatase
MFPLADSCVRKEVHFSGHVQGVGFRQTVCMMAEGYVMTGYVINLPDGRVKLVSEGDSQQLEDFLMALSRRMEQYIRDIHTECLPSTGEFSRFDIVF